MDIVKKVLSQRAIGYNADFTKTHFQHTVELADGRVVTQYSTDTTLPNGSISEGLWTTLRPFVDQPIPEGEL